MATPNKTVSMHPILFILGIILFVFFGSEFFRTFLLLQKSRAIVKDSISFQRMNPKAVIKILFLGDSTAVGTGAADPRDSVAGRFGRDFLDAHIVNLGKNGNKIKDLAREFNPEDYQGFNLIVIQAGGNDILRFTPLKYLEKDLRTILDKTKRVNRQVVILHSGNIGLAPFFPRPFGWVWSYRTLLVRELYTRIAKESGAVYVDLYAERKDDPFLKDVKRFYAPDLLHASGEGYGIWYNKIKETMERAGINL